MALLINDECEGTPNGTATLDNCGDCNGGDAADLGCGCDNPGPSGCDNACGSVAVDDDCGVCGGDNSSCSDECGIPNGSNACLAVGLGAAHGGLNEVYLAWSPSGDAVAYNIHRDGELACTIPSSYTQ